MVIFTAQFVALNFFILNMCAYVNSVSCLGVWRSDRSAKCVFASGRLGTSFGLLPPRVERSPPHTIGPYERCQCPCLERIFKSGAFLPALQQHPLVVLNLFTPDIVAS